MSVLCVCLSYWAHRVELSNLGLSIVPCSGTLFLFFLSCLSLSFVAGFRFRTWFVFCFFVFFISFLLRQKKENERRVFAANVIRHETISWSRPTKYKLMNRFSDYYYYSIVLCAIVQFLAPQKK